MDGEKFDRVVRLLASGVSRRGAVKGLTTAAVGAALTALGQAPTAAAPRRCATACANFNGPQKAACKQACEECGGNFNKVCQSGTGVFTCCPQGGCCYNPALGTFTCCPDGGCCHNPTTGTNTCCPTESGGCCCNQSPQAVCCAQGTRCCACGSTTRAPVCCSTGVDCCYDTTTGTRYCCTAATPRCRYNSTLFNYVCEAT